MFDSNCSSSTLEQSEEKLRKLGPSSTACKNAHRDLRMCLEANGAWLEACSSYLIQWKACEQQ